MEITEKKLVELAFEAAEKSYAPYSKYKVGAALLTSDGSIYKGANVENASYGGTICAERNAALHAVFDGKKEFSAIAVVGYHEDNGKKEASYAYPCGICRQFLREFAEKDMKVYVGKTPDDILKTTLEELMPHSFGPESLLE